MEERIEHTVGKRVRELREREGLSKTEFCLMVDISRPYLNSVEDGTANITLRMLARLAAGLDVHPCELMR